MNFVSWIKLLLPLFCAWAVSGQPPETDSPTGSPTPVPSFSPSFSPTFAPSIPTDSPTAAPVNAPTPLPTSLPTTALVRDLPNAGFYAAVVVGFLALLGLTFYGCHKFYSRKHENEQQVATA